MRPLEIDQQAKWLANKYQFSNPCNLSGGQDYYQDEWLWDWWSNPGEWSVTPVSLSCPALCPVRRLSICCKNHEREFCKGVELAHGESILSRLLRRQVLYFASQYLLFWVELGSQFEYCGFLHIEPCFPPWDHSFKWPNVKCKSHRQSANLR